MFLYANKVPHTAPSSPLGQLPLAGFSLELQRNCLWDWGLIKTELASLSLRHRLCSWWASGGPRSSESVAASWALPWPSYCLASGQ